MGSDEILEGDELWWRSESDPDRHQDLLDLLKIF